jgi:hypothetical protein
MLIVYLVAFLIVAEIIVFTLAFLILMVLELTFNCFDRLFYGANR